MKHILVSFSKKKKTYFGLIQILVNSMFFLPNSYDGDRGGQKARPEASQTEPKPIQT